MASKALFGRGRAPLEGTDSCFVSTAVLHGIRYVMVWLSFEKSTC